MNHGNVVGRARARLAADGAPGKTVRFAGGRHRVIMYDPQGIRDRVKSGDRYEYDPFAEDLPSS